MSVCCGTVYHLFYSLLHLSDSRDRFTAKILDEDGSTEEGAAAGASIEPEGDRVLVS